jgi:hypothetical protein
VREPPVPASTREVLSDLCRFGLLLRQDKCLPSAITLLLGEPLATSWWSHPKGRHIFRILTEIADHPDVLLTKLLFRKDTLVHRSLWPAFLAVATSGEAWQTRRLSAAARLLLRQTIHAKAPVTSAGAPVRELASRLLVHTAEVHTPGGAHRLIVDTWSSWAAEAGVAPLPSLSRARGELEAACQDLGAPLAALPWHSKPRARGASGPLRS